MLYAEVTAVTLYIQEPKNFRIMTTIICNIILAYCILGKDIKALMEKIGDVDWKRKADIYKLSIMQQNLMIWKILWN